MDRELTTLERAGTWVTVPRPTDKNIVGSKWVFCIKRKADGSVDKYKARLVARGFTQIYGVDYFTTFSPVSKLSSFCTLLAIAAHHNWDIQSFDFNGAYLNGELDENEEIYMYPAPGYCSGKPPRYDKPSLKIGELSGMCQPLTQGRDKSRQTTQSHWKVLQAYVLYSRTRRGFRQ